jgi:SlyX protein
MPDNQQTLGFIFYSWRHAVSYQIRMKTALFKNLKRNQENRMPKTQDNRIDQEAIFNIESRLAFQEDLLDSLNTLVCNQQKQIDQLWQANRQLKQQLEKMHFDTGSDEDNTPPPHY